MTTSSRQQEKNQNGEIPKSTGNDHTDDYILWNQLVLDSITQQPQQQQQHQQQQSNFDDADVPLPWQYMAEGGRHVIFSFNPRQHTTVTNTCNALDGWLLRFRKSDLAECFREYASNEDAIVSLTATSPYNNNNDKAGEDFTPHGDWNYIRDIVEPRLSPYVDVPKPIVVIPRALGVLFYRQAMSGNKIPPHRRASWMLEDTCSFPNSSQEPNSNTMTLEATLLREYRCPILKSTTAALASNQAQTLAPSCCWTVELKPKAGYRAFSPLVHPRRRIKYQSCRFQLMQQYKMTAQQQRRSHHSSESQSSIRPTRYDPLQLFSNVPKEIRMALENLADCPNHNLKLWKYDSRPTHGAKNYGIQQVTLPVDDNQAETKANVNLILDIVCLILQRESFLSKLLTLQQLDWVDADGAIFLYQHLLTLLPDLDPKAIQRKLDRELEARNEFDSEEDRLTFDDCARRQQKNGKDPPIGDTIGSVDSILRSCPVKPPSFANDGAFRQLLLAIDSFSNTLQDKRGDDAFLDTAYENCTNLIKTLNLEESIYLLQAWLLSLAMCDVSFFVSLELYEAGDLLHQNSKLQTTSEPGWFLHRATNEGTKDTCRLWVCYSIKMIDCDAKPSKKLASRQRKEEMYDLLPKA